MLPVVRTLRGRFDIEDTRAGRISANFDTSETSYGTGSSVSQASRLGGPRVNPPRGAMGGNPPIPQRGPGFVPNILNPINPT